MVGYRLGITRKHGCQRTSLAASAVSTLCMSCCLSALRVEILAHDVEIRDIAGQHAVKRGSAAKHGGLIRTPDPLVGGASVREKELESLVDAEDVGDSLERVACQPHLRFLAPLEIGGSGRQTQQGQLFGDGQMPQIGDPAKSAQTRSSCRTRFARWDPPSLQCTGWQAHDRLPVGLHMDLLYT